MSDHKDSPHILFADDHEITSRGFRDLALECCPGAKLTMVGDGQAVLRLLPTQTWDLVVVDIWMPGPPIGELIAAIRAHDKTLPVLVLTASEEISFVIETLRAGANGLVHKHHAADDMIQAIRTVIQGGHYLHPDVAAGVARYAQAHDTKPEPHHQLSAREFEIFLLLAKGHSIKEAAYEIGLSPKTVATHLTSIRTKTGLAGPVEIARYALKAGLVD